MSTGLLTLLDALSSASVSPTGALTILTSALASATATDAMTTEAPQSSAISTSALVGTDGSTTGFSTIYGIGGAASSVASSLDSAAASITYVPFCS
jgi:hypothetical protein